MDDEGVIGDSMLETTVENRWHVFYGKVLLLNEMV